MVYRYLPGIWYFLENISCLHIITRICAEHVIYMIKKRILLFIPVIGCIIFAVMVNSHLADGKNILVLGPHEDDEVLMCAGIIEWGLANGDTVKVAVVTNGDYRGSASKGKTRIRESMDALKYLNISPENMHYLGYGDTGMYPLNQKGSFLRDLYYAENDTTIISSDAGNQSYGVPENQDYHYQRFGAHGSYNRATLRQDLETLIGEFRPDDIYVSSLYDYHGDHSSLYLWVVDAIINVKEICPSYSPMLHQYMIHANRDVSRLEALYLWVTDSIIRVKKICSSCSPVFHQYEVYATYSGVCWPDRYSFGSFSKPVNWDNFTGGLLDWNKREIVSVPSDMQVSPRTSNRKYLAIDKYKSQRSEYLYSFVKNEEIFWKKDFANIALLASISVSSENNSTNQQGIKAIDGIADGYPHFDGRFSDKEWVTIGQKAGAWIKLSWQQNYMVNRIVLYDRPNTNDNIEHVTITFSDGSSVNVGQLTNNGTGNEITFTPKTINWVNFTLDNVSATTENVGLSEIDVYPSNDTNPMPTPRQYDD